MTKTTTEQTKRKAMHMDYNENKYWVEGSDLTEAEKIQMAKDLRELESRGVIQFHGGRWQLAAGPHPKVGMHREGR